jgi:hypothetical protein
MTLRILKWDRQEGWSQTANVHKILMGEIFRKRPLGKQKIMECNIMIYLREMSCEDGRWTTLDQDRVQ